MHILQQFKKSELKYYIEKKPNSKGKFVIHHKDCAYLLLTDSKKSIGYHSSILNALATEKNNNENAVVCIWCYDNL